MLSILSYQLSHLTWTWHWNEVVILNVFEGSKFKKVFCYNKVFKWLWVLILNKHHENSHWNLINGLLFSKMTEDGIKDFLKVFLVAEGSFFPPKRNNICITFLKCSLCVPLHWSLCLKSILNYHLYGLASARYFAWQHIFIEI